MSKGKILVVEPEVSVRNILENCLRATGYDVKRAKNIDADIDMLKTDTPDALIMNFRCAQSNPVLRAFNDVPILYLTDDVREVWNNLRAGDDYETHPYDLDSVCFKLERMMLRSASG